MRKRILSLAIVVCVFLLSACTSSVNSAEAPHTEQTEFVESAATDPAPTREIAGYTPDDEPVYEDQIYKPEPFYFDEYGARYLLVDGTIDEYYMDEDYEEVVETPDSTAFTVITYHHFHSSLTVQFRNSGAWYTYYDFEPETWCQFKNADSKGGFFNEFIKGQYEYERK